MRSVRFPDFGFFSQDFPIRVKESLKIKLTYSWAVEEYCLLQSAPFAIAQQSHDPVFLVLLDVFAALVQQFLVIFVVPYNKDIISKSD